jgi:short-subunit dehydrogenase
MTKTAIITGATKGLGRAIAQKLASEGFDLCVCARSASDLGAMAEYWGAYLPKAKLYTMAADLSSQSETLAFGQFCLDSLGQAPDILVNNTGSFAPGSVLNEPQGNLESMIEVNLYSAYYLSRIIVPAMVSRGSGHVFNMCSIASEMAYPNGGSYSVSKFALLGYTKVLREELKTANIKVTAIMPGATWSDSWKGVDLPESRLMQASDIAETLWGAYNLSASAVVEEITLRPQLGDL